MTGLIWLLLLIAVTVFAPLVSAADLKEIGDEVPVGLNATGEPCRVRLVERTRDAVDLYRFSIYCDGWSQPSGEIRRFRGSGNWPPERLVAEGPWYRSLSGRLTDCAATEIAALIDSSRAALRACKRSVGGWPVVVVATWLGWRAYTLETFPTNVRVLEAAVDVLEGRRRPDGGREHPGTVSAAIRRSETLVGASGTLIGIQDIGAFETLWSLGILHRRAGNYFDAEAAMRRALDIHERFLGPHDPSAGVILAEIGLDLGLQRRFNESDLAYQRAEILTQRSLARDHYPMYLSFRCATETVRGRYDEAVRFGRTADALREQQDPKSNGRAQSLTDLAWALWRQGRLDEAERTFDKALRIVEVPGGSDPSYRAWKLGEVQAFLGHLHLDQQRPAQARAALEASLKRRELLFGESVKVVQSLVGLGRALQLQGDSEAALSAFRRAARIQTKDRAARESAGLASVVPYLDALLARAALDLTQRDTLHGEAFVTAQIPRGTETARAVQAMTTRVAAGDPALAAVARSLQDSVKHRDAVRFAIGLETLKPTDKRTVAHEASLKQQYRDAEKAIEILELRLQAEFPKYARLMSERPISSAEIGKILRPAEAIVTFVIADSHTFVFLVRGETVNVHRAAISRVALEEDVRVLRESLDRSRGVPRVFDVARASRLYDLLLRPVSDQLAGITHLFTVPAGPLLSLPLGMLVAKPVSADEPHLNIPWLAREFAISVLPSVQTLHDLRTAATASAATLPFIGFGDPDFTGTSADRRDLTAVATTCGPDTFVDLALLRRVPRLPETAEELKRIAQALGASPDSVILGSEATETRVREIDLRQYRIVGFATHGLLPGVLACQAEPALLLTPPAVASARDDGLLKAGEVAQLALDADVVMLSACDTAGPDGSLNGESLSGLTRAFLYSGARAVLASHWAVASEPTVLLTTEMFEKYGRDPARGYAEALRLSQMAMLSRGDLAHPFFWAPFVFVGDGGRTTRGPTSGLQFSRVPGLLPQSRHIPG